MSAEILAGVTLAALAVPEVLGYARIAGMPPVTGLYTLLVPVVAFAVLGSSRHLVVGADSATAAIMAAGLVGMAASGSPTYVAYAGLLALITAALLVLGRIVRLDFLADFLSRTVLIGFLTGVGIHLVVSQLPGMLGVAEGAVGPLSAVAAAVHDPSRAHAPTIAVSLLVIAVIAGTRKVSRRIPGALLAVAGTIYLSYAMDLQSHGVAVIGAVPGGLPRLTLPAAALSVGVLGRLLPIALSMCVVILAQSAATSRAYAVRYREDLDEAQDLLGLGIANLGAGLTGTFVVNGSPTKTQMVDGAGGRTQLAQLVTAAVVVLVLLFLTGPLAYLPSAVLSAIVFLIGIELVDVRGLRSVLAERPVEFWVAAATATAVVIAGVEPGIFLAAILSLVSHTRHGYKPRDSLLTIGPDGGVRVTPIGRPAQIAPGLVVYRFNHSMYYANTDHLTREVRALVETASPPLRWFCIDMVAVDDIDFSAAAALREIAGMLHAQGVRLVLSDLQDDVRQELERSGIVELLGADAVFPSPVDVIRAYGGIAPTA